MATDPITKELDEILVNVKPIDEGFPEGFQPESMPIPIYGAVIALGCSGTVTYNEWDHDVFLTEVGPNRVLCIKVVRELFGLSLDESRALVGSLPKKLIGEIELREARAIKSRFEKIGARVEIRQTEDGLIKD
jgi:ribosomal protein L7/L12